ncbi:helix-turn-helix transcriptional regulator [Flavobacterium endoglycinae]|uniref:Helix-turn-helix transcriptional regulator n=1 Tax=Flavobacterium endoglycinae TaxID=2816357 RepID=A0ABX7QI47_9FLAO|nr:helix-turn-helix transcriptional regulator [Flavobacterium endoglycinae]QSW90739.1 helix-turn-helix transcriptional regulator [Flavobacterium endoglycinae]
MSKSTTERLSEYMAYRGINNNALTVAAELSVGQIGKAISNNSGINSSSIEKILYAYPELNAEWLLTGNGNMIKESSEPVNNRSEEKKGIPLIPIEAMAGYGQGDSQVMQYDINSGYKIPELEGKGVKYLIRVSGSSMYPKYSNGDLLACKPLKDLAFFQWGKPYVLDTEQGAIVKRLFPCDEDIECLECHSDNKTHYPPFKIPKSSVRAVAIVVGVIRLE